MIKNKVLTPVLAGVLGVSVVGSGVGYYLVNKGDKEVKPEQTMDSMKISLTQVENSVNTTVDDVQKAVTGQLDYAYNSSVKVTFGDALNNLGLGTGTNNSFKLKPIEIDTKVKQKGQNSQADIIAKYDDATLVTLESVFTGTGDSKTGYFRVPELSSAYIKATEADLRKLFDDAQKKYQQKVQVRRLGGNTVSGNNNATTIAPQQQDGTSILSKVTPQMPDLSGVDSKKLQEKINSYMEIVKSKLPGKTDGADITGDIDGNKYNYKTVSYSVNGKQAQDAVYAVLDKAASDTDIKKFFDDYMAKQSASARAASKVKSYADLIAKLREEFKVSAKDQGKTATLNLYYDGEELTGCAFRFDDKTYLKAVVINKSDVNAIDVLVSDGKEGDTFTVKGSSKLSDGTVSGTYAAEFKDGGKTEFTMKLNLDKVVVKKDYFNGTISFDTSVNNGTSNKSFGIKISGTSKTDKKDLTLSVDMDGKNAFSVAFKLDKTEATDVAVPTENIFTLDQMDAYKKTCDIENFKSAINGALGTNVFGIFDSFKSLSTNSGAANSTTGTTANGYNLFSF